MNSISIDDAASALFHAILSGKAFDVRNVLLQRDGLVHASFRLYAVLCGT